MQVSFRQLSKVHVMLVSLFFAAMLTTLAVSKHWSGRKVTAATSVAPARAVPAPPAVVRAKETTEPLIVEEITLRPTGFYPAKFSRPKGAFLLVVCNRTGLEEVNITLSRDAGNGVKEKTKEAKVHRKVLDWNDTVDLNPGTYLLTEASHPKWVCELTITPK